MAKFRKLALLCTAILACGVMATTTGCALFQPIPDGPISESSSSEIPEVTKFTIKFVNEDGTVLQESQVEEGQLPAYTGATPTKASTVEHSYEFAGWDVTIVEATADAVYTATFTQSVNNYVVSFDVDGGSAVDAQTVPYGTSASELANFSSTKVGYTFAGWTLENGSAIPDGATVTGNITVKAAWTPATDTAYNIEVYAESLAGGYELLSTIPKTGTTNATATLGEADLALVPAGFVFDAENASNAVSGTIAPDGSLVLKVYINRQSYTVTYYDYDGSQITTETVKYEGAATYAEVPTRDDVSAYGPYVFNKWVTSQDGTTSADLSSVKGATSVYASYVIKPFLEPAVVNEAWNVSKEVTFTSEVKYGEEMQSAKVKAGAGEKYATFKVVANTDDRAGVIEFFIKNTTGATLQVYSPFNTDRIISVAASDDWQFIQLHIDGAQAEYKVCVRGVNESVINTEECYFYVSNVTFNSEVYYKLMPQNDPWGKAKSTSYETNVTYGDELSSTKVTTSAGNDRASITATAITSTNTGYINFYVKNTTGSRLKLYNSANPVMIYLDNSDEWQYVRMAINADQTEVTIVVYGVDANNNSQAINADDACYYVSEIKPCEVYYSIGETDDVWSKPASLSYVTNVAYGTEAGSMKVGVKVGEARANLIATATATKAAGYVEFYIKNTTGKALRVYSNHGTVMNYLTASEDWQLVRFPIDETAGSFYIYVYSQDDSKFSETDVVYYYVSDVKPCEVYYSIGETDDVWSKPASITYDTSVAYDAESGATKVGVKVGDMRACLIATATTSKRASYAEFYIKNTTGKALRVYSSYNTVINYLTASEDWQLVRFPIDATAGSFYIYVYSQDDSKFSETDVVYYYVSNIMFGEGNYSMSLNNSDSWGKAKSIETSYTETYGTESTATKVTVNQGYDRASFLLTPLSTATGYVEFYVKNTTGSRLKLYNNANTNPMVYLEISDEWQLVRLPSTTAEGQTAISVIVYGVDADGNTKAINADAETIYYVSNPVNAE